MSWLNPFSWFSGKNAEQQPSGPVPVTLPNGSVIMAQNQQMADAMNKAFKDPANNNIQDAFLIAGAQIMPDYFLPMLQSQHPGLISNSGAATVHGNMIMDFEKRIQQKGMFSAQMSDLSTIADTITNMRIATAQMSGNTLTEGQVENIKLESNAIAQTLPAMVAAAKMSGVSQETIDTFLNGMYGAKGSVANLYQQGYGALRPFTSASGAASIMNQLISNTFGSNWTPNATEGVNATDMGAILQYMAANGGLTRSMVQEGMSGTIPSYETFLNKAVDWHMGSGGWVGMDDALNASFGGVGAGDMPTLHDVISSKAREAYISEAMSDKNRDVAFELLDPVLDGVESFALETGQDIEAKLASLKDTLGVDLSLDLTDRNKDNVLDKLNKKFEEHIKKAMEDKNEKREKELFRYKDLLTSDIKDLYRETGRFNEDGTVETYRDLNARKKEILMNASKDYADEVTVEFNQDAAAIEAQKRDLFAEDMTGEEQLEALRRLNWEEENRDRKIATDKMYAAVAQVTQRSKVKEDAISLGHIVQGMQDAYAAQGKQVSAAEVLSQSKALIGDNLKNLDLQELEEHIGALMQDVLTSGRSMDSLRSSAAAYQGTAAAAGLRNTNTAAIINTTGELNYSAYVRNGMTDADARAQIAKDKANLTNVATSSAGKALASVTGFLKRQSQEDINAALEQLNPKDRELLVKIQQGERLTNAEFRNMASSARRIVRALPGYENMAEEDISNILYSEMNVDMGMNENVMQNIENYANRLNFKKLAVGGGDIFGADNVKDGETRDAIELAIATHAQELRNARNLSDRKEVFRAIATELDKAGFKDASANLLQNLRTNAGVERVSAEIGRRIMESGDPALITAMAENRKTKVSERQRKMALDQNMRELGKANPGGFAGVVQAINEGKSLADVMNVFSAVVGTTNVERKDWDTLMDSLVLGGLVEAGDFTNIYGQLEHLSQEDIRIASEAAGMDSKWRHMNAEERKNTKSGIWSKGKELTVEEALDIANKAGEKVQKDVLKRTYEFMHPDEITELYGRDVPEDSEYSETEMTAAALTVADSEEALKAERALRDAGNVKAADALHAKIEAGTLTGKDISIAKEMAGMSGSAAGLSAPTTTAAGLTSTSSGDPTAAIATMSADIGTVATDIGDIKKMLEAQCA